MAFAGLEKVLDALGAGLAFSSACCAPLRLTGRNGRVGLAGSADGARRLFPSVPPFFQSSTTTLPLPSLLTECLVVLPPVLEVLAGFAVLAAGLPLPPVLDVLVVVADVLVVLTGLSVLDVLAGAVDERDVLAGAEDERAGLAAPADGRAGLVVKAGSGLPWRGALTRRGRPRGPVGRREAAEPVGNNSASVSGSMPAIFF